MRYLLLLLMLASAPAHTQPYDESADAGSDIRTALQAARTNGKFVLLTFGANWCKDCLVLAEQVQESPLRELIETNFIEVKVDVGDYDKNMDIEKRYGKVTERGIPTIVVLDQDNNVLTRTLTGQLANARNMGKEELYNFFVSVAERAVAAAGKPE